MPAENAITSLSAADRPAAPGPDAPIAIRVEGLHKSFRIPTHRVDSLKERMVRPFSPKDYRELQALDEISFEIRQGEFFGIVGRNGSGKSTLLKLLASIYRADAGTIRMAGRLAPFIELGVGFNTELTARENVILNGVMMGLTPAETRGRLDAIVGFAELEDFVDLKLKNYSSGMLVRLAFSVMLEADADILLIDEVLAVGDAAFQQKCADAFRAMKATGKTIVLVTHEMSTVEEYCHRAMLLDGGRIQHVGDPAEVGRHYLRLNFEQDGDGVPPAEAEEDKGVRLLDAWIEDDAGERVANVEHGEEIRLRVQLEVGRDFPGLGAGFIVANADDVGVAQFGTLVPENLSEPLRPGQRIEVGVELENRFTPGRYFVHCGVTRHDNPDVLLYVPKCVDFVVFGGDPRGIVTLEHSFDVKITDGGDSA